MSRDRSEQVFQDLLYRAVERDPAVHSGVLRVTGPGLDWACASGFSDPEAQIPMGPEDQFQIASITKMVTATVLLMLAEEGRIELDSGIGRYLPTAVIEGLHVYRGWDYGAEITARQLLSHTSGVADFFGDGAPGEGGILPFVAQMQADPDRFWDPLDILAWTKQNLSAHFEPGGGWHYSDTGFLLAGLIVEQVTGDRLHDVMRERLFAPLNMPHTYMLYREPARPSREGRSVSPAFTGDAAYGLTRSVTADWACGGLVSTVTDLTRFIRSMAGNRIFQNPVTRNEMLDWTPTGEPGVSYGLGVRRFGLAALGLAAGGELWGHTGFIKSFMLYWPEGDATVCGTLNQASAQGALSELRPVAALVVDVLREMQQDPLSGPA